MPLRKRTASAVSARAQKRPCQQQSIVDDNFAAEQSDASPREARMPPCNSSSNSTVYTTFRHKKVQSRILATVLTTNELCIGRQSAEKLSTLPGFRAYHKEMMYERLFVKLDTGDVVSVEEHFDLLIQLILVVISKEGVATQAPHNKALSLAYKEGALQADEKLLASEVVSAFSACKYVKKYIRKLSCNLKTKIRCCHAKLFSTQPLWATASFRRELAEVLENGISPRKYQVDNKGSYMQTAIEAVCIMIGAYDFDENEGPEAFMDQTSIMVESTAQQMLLGPPREAWTSEICSRATDGMNPIRDSRRELVISDSDLNFFKNERLVWFKRWGMVQTLGKSKKDDDSLNNDDTVNDDTSLLTSDWR